MKRGNLLLLVATVCCCLSFVGLSSAKSIEMPKVFWRIQTHTSMDPPDILKEYSQYLKATPESLPTWSTCGQTLELARRVKERTNGKFILKLYTAGELFKPGEMYEACEKGAVEMLAGYGTYFSGRNPAGDFSCNIPFGTDSWEEGTKLVFETEYVKVIRRAYAKNNLYFLFPLEAGLDGLSTKFPVQNIMDFKGKLIRAQGIKAKVVQRLGATSVPITTAEQYTALQRGTIDGIFFPPHVSITYKLVEQVNYVIWPTFLNPTFCEWVINMNSWNKLPPEYQTVLAEEAMSLTKWAMTKMGPWQTKWAQEQNTKLGVKNIYLPKEEWDKFKKACLPIWDELGALSSENAELIQIYKKLGGSRGHF
jgi:TRAP-type C4-dicarboxylate transport system substrate-binding protein